MKKLDTGGLFTCEDPATDSGRVARFEISPTGPMFGHRMLEPRLEAQAREQRVLASEGLTPASFAPLKADGEGTRRPMRLRLALEVQEDGPDLRLSFALEKGSFATVVLREVQKGEVATDLPEERE
jgi:tRNA pseudouridine13 synthase